MADATPVLMRWTDDEVLKPVGPHWESVAARQFTIGENYRIVPVIDRSEASHRHFFAALHESWLNLPETVAASFPSEDHLRKYALIKAGYANSREFVAGSKAEALRLAAFMRSFDEYAVVTVLGAVVTVYTAKSQSAHAMDKETFQKSKQDCLDIVAAMIGVSSTDLAREGGK